MKTNKLTTPQSSKVLNPPTKTNLIICRRTGILATSFLAVNKTSKKIAISKKENRSAKKSQLKKLKSIKYCLRFWLKNGILVSSRITLLTVGIKKKGTQKPIKTTPQ